MTDAYRMNDKYTPIDCSLHSEYELAIMHHDRLQLAWHGADGTTHIETLLPTDLCTRNGEEFLEVTCTDGSVREIRLDHIVNYKRV